MKEMLYEVWCLKSNEDMIQQLNCPASAAKKVTVNIIPIQDYRLDGE